MRSNAFNHFFFSFCIAALGSRSGFAAATTQPAPSEPTIYWTARALGIDPGTVDPLPELAAAIKSPDAQNLDSLVDVILHAKFTAIRDAVISHTTLQEGSEHQVGHDPSWPYGEAKDRMNLRSIMWNSAKTLAQSDPAKAKRYALAAILFCAMDDFPFGPNALTKFLNDRSGLGIAGIDADTAQYLRSAVRFTITRPVDFEGHARAAVDRLYRHPQPSEFDDAWTAINQWRAAVPTEDEQRQLCLVLQQFLNHAAAVGQPDLLKKYEQSLSAWIQEAREPMKRWLTEALQQRGKPQPVNGGMVWKDGKWVQVDTDGNAP